MKPFDRRRQVYKQAQRPQRKRIKLLNYLNLGETNYKEEPRTSRQREHTNTRKQTEHRPHAPLRGAPRQVEIPRDFYHCIPPGLTSLEISLLEFDQLTSPSTSAPSHLELDKGANRRPQQRPAQRIHTYQPALSQFESKPSRL